MTKNLNITKTGEKQMDDKQKLILWNEVCTTDKKYTKPVKFGEGGREFTAINAQHQLHNATKQFGPYGIGFGVRNETFNIIDGIVLYQADFWYKIENKKEGEFPIHSSTRRIDEDFAKKIATDALTKGLSKLGFNADIFLGEYDDNKYVQNEHVASTGETQSQIDYHNDNIEMEADNWETMRNNKVGFGKHKNNQWKDVEGGYLDWIVEVADKIDEIHKERARNEIQYRAELEE